MAGNDKRTDLREEYWATIKSSNLKEAITLEADNAASDVEFHVYGLRLADRYLEKMQRFSKKPFAWSSIIDIGCGVGRFTLPFACRFHHVFAVDIDEEVISEARNYCRSTPNVSYHVNDGETLEEFSSDSVDYAFCGGVLQHIKYFEVIVGYIKEALRVLREGGLFGFSFQIWQTNSIGRIRVGAKITAKKLERALADSPYEICFMQIDPKDPVPHCYVVIRKTELSDRTDPSGAFSTFPVDRSPFRTGVFEDLESCGDLREKWKDTPRPITFYDR